jgi:hypothetical protein
MEHLRRAGGGDVGDIIGLADGGGREEESDRIREFSRCRGCALRRTVDGTNNPQPQGATMSHYTVSHLAEMRLQETARQARTAWWRARNGASENERAIRPSMLLHWSLPVSARITGA